MKTYEPQCGSDIADACQEAVAFAKKAGVSQTFDFNGVSVIATAESDPAALVSKFRSDQEASNKAWRESPEGQRAESERAAEITRKQARHDELMKSLPDALSERRDSLMRWLRDFTEVADDIGVQKNLPWVMRQLEQAGYVSGDACGLPKAEYEKPAIMSAYIVGQAMSCMNNGMPPHPMLSNFVQRYFKLVP